MVQRSVGKVITPRKQREGGGFVVRRVIGGVIPSCDPLLMLDHFGPVDFGPGEAIGAPDHPHRGFETVTYMIQGESCHKDSVGNSGTLGPGWVQWMTAGSGVVHSEMPSKRIQEKGGRSEGFQLWVNLPAKDKMIPPRYQDTPPEKIPVADTDDKKVKVKVIAGESLGRKAYIETRIPIMYLDIHLQPGTTFTQPVHNSFDGFVYVWRGEGQFGASQTTIQCNNVALLEKGDDLTITTSSTNECRLLLIAGKPLNEPIVWHGPFVMNTREQIDQAIQDYHAGRLGKIDGMEERMKETERARQQQKRVGTWSNT